LTVLKQSFSEFAAQKRTLPRMKQPRRITTMVVLILTVAISMAGAVQVLRVGVPDPEFPTQQDVVDWLTSHNVREDKEATRLKLSRRLEHDFMNDVQRQSMIEPLSQEERRQFEENFSELMRVLFVEKANEFAGLSERQRDRFLDQQIVSLQKWQYLSRSNDRVSEGGAKRRPLMSPMQFMWDLNEWVGEASPKQRRRIEEFQSQLVARFQERLQEFKQNKPAPDQDDRDA
jgi:hypothetical protein